MNASKMLHSFRIIFHVRIICRICRITVYYQYSTRKRKKIGFQYPKTKLLTRHEIFVHSKFHVSVVRPDLIPILFEFLNHPQQHSGSVGEDSWSNFFQAFTFRLMNGPSFFLAIFATVTYILASCTFQKHSSKIMRVIIFYFV